ncbi:MAG: N-6 DNA methylase [Acidobacteria bacterium]|nr:N-6 DNA methylase [Acidobacteriota bacterium]
MPASSEAVDQLAQRVNAQSRVQSVRSIRNAFSRTLLGLDDKIGNPAWTDGCDVIGSAYERVIPGRDRRRLGQFFTPIDLGRVMARWVLEGKPSQILDPGCGSGSLLIAAAHEEMGETRLVGLDVDPLAVEMAVANVRLRRLEGVEFRTADFLLDEIPGAPDGIICNPPYTRHQELSARQKEAIYGGFRKRLGIDFSQLSSLHALFLIRAIEISSPGARLAFITPSHWLDKIYAVPIKEYVLAHAHVETIVGIPAAESVFEHAVTTATITFITKGAKTKDTRLIQSSSGRGLDVHRAITNRDVGQHVRLSSNKKWSRIPVSLSTGPRLGDLAKVRRGVATGCNEFFVLSEGLRKELGIARCSVVACLPSPKQLHSELVTQESLSALPSSTRRWLLNPQKIRREGPLAEYLDHGLDTYGLLDRRLVKDRVSAKRKWHQVNPNVRSPIVATYINRGPNARFVRNQVGAVVLNNWLAIEPRPGVDVEALFEVLNHPTVLKSLRQHAREYGNDMWKLEPSELSDIRLPTGSILIPDTLNIKQ